MNKATTLAMQRYVLSKSFDLPYIQNEDHTISKYLGSIESTPSRGRTYTMDYIVMGNNGYESITGSDGPMDKPISGVPGRNSRIGILYGHLPFRIFKAGTDLHESERGVYGCRVRLTHEGYVYLAYFTKRIDPSIHAEEIITSGVNGFGVTQPIEPIMQPIRATEATGMDMVTVSRKLDIPITDIDIAAARKYGLLKYGHEDHGIIREIGLCIGTEGDDGAPTAEGIELVSSANLGWSDGIKVPRTVKMSVGRATSVLRL